MTVNAETHVVYFGKNAIFNDFQHWVYNLVRSVLPLNKRVLIIFFFLSFLHFMDSVEEETFIF